MVHTWKIDESWFFLWVSSNSSINLNQNSDSTAKFKKLETQQVSVTQLGGHHWSLTVVNLSL